MNGFYAVNPFEVIICQAEAAECYWNAKLCRDKDSSDVLAALGASANGWVDALLSLACAYEACAVDDSWPLSRVEDCVEFRRRSLQKLRSVISLLQVHASLGSLAFMSFAKAIHRTNEIMAAE